MFKRCHVCPGILESFHINVKGLVKRTLQFAAGGIDVTAAVEILFTNIIDVEIALAAGRNLYLILIFADESGVDDVGA